MREALEETSAFFIYLEETVYEKVTGTVPVLDLSKVVSSYHSLKNPNIFVRFYFLLRLLE